MSQELGRPEQSFGPGHSQGFGGSGLSGAGDLNGDGYADLALGASLAGTVTVYFGGATGVGVSPTVLPTPSGASSFGSFISGVGDVDGDGFSDLAVSAISSNSVHLYRGGAMGPGATPSNTLTGAPNTSYGGSIARARAGRVTLSK